MSCVLHVHGREFDPDAFLATASLRPYGVLRRGEPAFAGSDRKRPAAGLSCEVSAAADLATQVADARAFLKRHREDLARLADDPAVDGLRLDFGYACRLNERILVQTDYLPPELLRLAGQFRIGIELSLSAGLRGLNEADR